MLRFTKNLFSSTLLKFMEPYPLTPKKLSVALQLLSSYPKLSNYELSMLYILK